MVSGCRASCWLACWVGLALVGLASGAQRYPPCNRCTIEFNFLDEEGFSIVAEVESQDGDHSAIFSWGGTPPFAAATRRGVIVVDPDKRDNVLLEEAKVDLNLDIEVLNETDFYLSSSRLPGGKKAPGSKLLPDLEAIVQRVVELSPQREDDPCNDLTILRGGPIKGEVAWGRERSCTSSPIAAARFEKNNVEVIFSSILQLEHARMTRRLSERRELQDLPLRTSPHNTTLRLGEPYIRKVFPINSREAYQNAKVGQRDWDEGTRGLHQVSVLKPDRSQEIRESTESLRAALMAIQGVNPKGTELIRAIKAARYGVRRWAPCRSGGGPLWSQTIRSYPGVEPFTLRAWCEANCGRLEVDQWEETLRAIAVEPKTEANDRAEVVDLLAMAGGFGWGSRARTWLDGVPADGEDVRAAIAAAAVQSRCAEQEDLDVLKRACKDTSVPMIRRRTTLQAALLVESRLVEAEQVADVLLQTKNSIMVHEDEWRSLRALEFAAVVTVAGREGIVAAVVSETPNEYLPDLELLLSYYETVPKQERIKDPVFCKLCSHARIKTAALREHFELARTPDPKPSEWTPEEYFLFMRVPEWAAIASLGIRDDEFNKQFVRMALVIHTKYKGIWYSALKNYILSDGLLSDHLVEVENIYDKIPKDYVVSLAGHLKRQAEAGEIATKDREAVMKFAAKALQDADPNICSTAKAIRESLRYADSASE